MKLNINYRMLDCLREDIEITKFYKNIFEILNKSEKLI